MRIIDRMAKLDDIQIQIPIESFSQKGYGVGRFQRSAEGPKRKVVVPGAIPGDIALVTVGKRRKAAFAGVLNQVVEPSKDRVAARCVHAPGCGGCSWQQMSYAKQCEEKERGIQLLFSSFAGLVIHPIIPCEDPWQYRNKMEYSFSQNKAGEKFVGLTLAASKGRVFHLTECHLTSPWFADVVVAVRRWWEESSLLAYHLYANTGSLRTLTLREAKHTKHKLVMLTVSSHPDFAPTKKDLEAFVEAVRRATPAHLQEKLSVFLRIQQAIKGSATQFYEMVLFGKDHIKEELVVAGKKYDFTISPTAFFQPNTLQAEVLYAKALSMAGEGPYEHVMDLYAGTATLGIVFSSVAKKVTSIELNPHAVFDAKKNQEESGIAHLTIYQGDVSAVLDTLSKEAGFVPPDLVVVDPPRTGLDLKAVDLLVKMAPKKILYISCNPATLSANAQTLSSQGYRMQELQPVDQFPHTVHVECIAIFEKGM